MVTYKRCTEANEDEIFQAIQIGFSDYMIKFEMTKESFIKHFFGPEGNRPEYSVIAFDGDKPIGLNLGGIKEYEGIKTLRCGALCVHPDYRGTGVSSRLFELHKGIAMENNCGQMFLEVIVGNDRAISFYGKKGYEKVYDLSYYSNNNVSEIKAPVPYNLSIRRIDFDTLRGLSKSTSDIHVNWQNDFDYISRIENQIHYGVFHKDKLMGGLSIYPSGRINFLWVDPEIRTIGVARSLLSYAVEELNLKRMVVCFPNNATLLGFVKRMGFTKDAISQYEMYYTL